MMAGLATPSDWAWKLVRMRWVSTGAATRFQVLHPHQVTAMQHGPRLGAADQILHGARAGAPTHPFLDPFRRLAR